VTLTASPDRSARRSGARLTRNKNRSSEPVRYHATVESILLSPEQDADTLVWLATAPQVSLGSGRVLARPARPARIPAAVDARDRPQHRTQVLGPSGRGDRHGLTRSWRRQGGTAWLLLGHLSAGAGMIEQQPHEVPCGAVSGDGLGEVLTGFGATITSRCSTSCLAQLRRDAAVPDDDSRRAGQSREPRRTRAASRPRGGCAGASAGRRHRPAEPSEVDGRVRPTRAAASPNAAAAPASSRLSPHRSASARGSWPPRSRREAC
jgi:hypothetical protein